MPIYEAKSLIMPGCVQAYIIYFVRLSVCLLCTVYVQHSWFLLIARAAREADFHEPVIYGSGRVWANAWDVFRRSPSRGCLGRRAAVDFVVCFG